MLEPIQGEAGIIVPWLIICDVLVGAAHGEIRILSAGFVLSNPEDEKRMLDPVWRDKLVDRLVDAVTRYRSPMVSAMP
mgnify:CR=1 FL=1